MATYIDAYEFLAEGTINILRSSGFWNKTSDSDWETLIDELEIGAVASITATVNFANIDNNTIITELVKNHVAYNLFMGLNHNETYIDQATIYINRYDDLIGKIRESQLDSDIKSEETFLQIPAIFIGKGG